MSTCYNDVNTMGHFCLSGDFGPRYSYDFLGLRGIGGGLLVS